jgi:UDP-N-acetylmuramate-alanine ligase
VVVSPEIDWLGGYGQADPTNLEAILNAMKNQWARNRVVLAHQQRRDLFTASAAAEKVWADRFA